MRVINLGMFAIESLTAKFDTCQSDAVEGRFHGAL